MTDKEVAITNRLGMHARAAARFVNLACRFDCEVYVCSGDKRVNGKSIMGLMMLAAGVGTTLTIETNGNDEEQAAEELCQLIEAGFGEEEQGQG